MPQNTNWLITGCFNALILVIVSTTLYSQPTHAQLIERSDGSTVLVPIDRNILWDQSDNPSDTDIVSQDFIDGAPFNVFDARAADDFLIPEAYIWRIGKVKVFGTFDNNAPDNIQSIDVVFYENEGGLPGEIIDNCNYTNILPVDITDPSFMIELPAPCTLRPGTYWMSIRANMFFLPNGQWFWNERTIQTLNPFVWQNPGNAFGTGCTSYSYAMEKCGAGFPDLTFQLVGEESPFPQVPALGTFGLALLSIAIGLVCIFYYSRKKLLSPRTKLCF